MVFLPKPLRKAKRRSAFILPKDAGVIIAELPLTGRDVVVEIGGGNGYLTFYLAQIAKEVYVFERNEEQFKILSENVRRWGLTNVFLYQKDGLESEVNGTYILDTPEAVRIVKEKEALIEKGVAYLPQITQAHEFVIALPKAFKSRVIRIIEEEWEVSARVVRPKHKQLVHTAFLSFFWRR